MERKEKNAGEREEKMQDGEKMQDRERRRCRMERMEME